MKKTFGIIGAGNIGKAVAHHLLKAGFEVTLSNSKGPDSLKETITALGGNAKAGSLQDAAKEDIVVLALPWTAINTLSGLADWKNKLVIDITNNVISMQPYTLANLNGKASSEVISETIPGARIVKAFNTLWFKILESDPRQGGGNRVTFVSGDDADAKKEISEIINSLGFAAVDIGSLAHSKLHQLDGLLANLNLIKVKYDVVD